MYCTFVSLYYMSEGMQYPSPQTPGLFLFLTFLVLYKAANQLRLFQWERRWNRGEPSGLRWFGSLEPAVINAAVCLNVKVSPPPLPLLWSSRSNSKSSAYFQICSSQRNHAMGSGGLRGRGRSCGGPRGGDQPSRQPLPSKVEVVSLQSDNILTTILGKF